MPNEADSLVQRIITIQAAATMARAAITKAAALDNHAAAVLRQATLEVLVESLESVL